MALMNGRRFRKRWRWVGAFADSLMVFAAVAQAKAGKFKGGSDLVFDLKNGGMSVGKISPAVPSEFIALMNSYKAKIIAGTLKVPTGL